MGSRLSVCTSDNGANCGSWRNAAPASVRAADLTQREAKFTSANVVADRITPKERRAPVAGAE